MIWTVNMIENADRMNSAWAMVTAVETDPEAVEVVVWDGEKKRSLTGIALNVEGLGGELVLLCEATATETTGCDGLTDDEEAA